MLFQGPPGLPSVHLCSDFWTIFVWRFKILVWGVIARLEPENRIASHPRVLWLPGVFRGSRMLGANMGFEFLIALLFEVLLHLVH